MSSKREAGGGGYSPLPTQQAGEASGSRQSSTTSSLTCSPLQHAIASLHPLAHQQAYTDQDADGGEETYYELSEKRRLTVHHSTRQEQQQRRRRADYYAWIGMRDGTLMGGVVGFVQRGKTIILLAICLLLSMMLLLQDNSTPLSSPTRSKSAIISSIQPPTSYRLEDDLVLITKVGSATVHKRLLIHLASQPTSNIYTPNTLYVSDYPLTLGNITFFDALSNVSSTISQTEEFSTLHRELVALLESNQDLDTTMDHDAGWKLDKYKFLPMVAEAWRRFPRKKWYVIVEADTFLFFNQLVKWLSTLDPQEQYMFGHPSFCDYDGKSTMFTHGGSGIVLSRGIMEASFGTDSEFEHNHDDLIQKSAFGDALLSKAIYDSDSVTLSELSPQAEDRFNSDPPRILKFHRANWCKSILTFHHITPADAAHLYDFQNRIEPRLAADDTVKWADVWDEFIPGFLKQAMEEVGRFDEDSVLKAGSAEVGEVGVIGWQAFEDWDSETTNTITPSAVECQSTCREDVNCLMWEWRKGHGEREQDWGGGRRRKRSEGRKRNEMEEEWGKCRYTSDFLRIGITKPKQADLTTGYMGKRIDRWRKDLECSGRTGLNSYSALQDV
ncbi:uncharacterized protein UTRI_10198 [Ustilago trichophora]|uniref:N-acetylgalactosaminide beta-1,3-galactosyltransferase n=1 Tax=Ustilago trichophora TaxID=86804 RepID=A0A5C3EF51_9BASI|nr:uncharacterized protein UTRI_10198 [Ustilago trichophora]